MGKTFNEKIAVASYEIVGAVTDASGHNRGANSFGLGNLTFDEPTFGSGEVFKISVRAGREHAATPRHKPSDLSQDLLLLF